MFSLKSVMAKISIISKCLKVCIIKGKIKIIKQNCKHYKNLKFCNDFFKKKFHVNINNYDLNRIK